jgi:hypothetical protein
MDLAAAQAWLDARLNHETGSVGLAAGKVDGLSLAPMEALLALLGDPQHAMPVVHVTGTNGKGSVAAMVTRLLEAHGLSVGTYTSPHLHRINERIGRNGEPISDADLAEALAGVAAVESLMDQPPTWFEVMTAAALQRAGAEASSPEEREHVTWGIHTRPDRWRLVFHSQAADDGDVRWTVDRPDDYEFAAAVYGDLYPSDPAFGSDAIRRYVRSRPDLLHHGGDRRA